MRGREPLNSLVQIGSAAKHSAISGLYELADTVETAQPQSQGQVRVNDIDMAAKATSLTTTVAARLCVVRAYAGPPTRRTGAGTELNAGLESGRAARRQR